MRATPRAEARLGVVAVGDGDLLGARRQVGARGEVVATVGQPRRGRELQAAVVAVAGVDRPVAAGLALGDAVPHGGVGQVDAGAGGVARARGVGRAAGGPWCPRRRPRRPASG